MVKLRTVQALIAGTDGLQLAARAQPVPAATYRENVNLLSAAGKRPALYWQVGFNVLQFRRKVPLPGVDRFHAITNHFQHPD